METLFQEVVRLGIEHDHHYSDLYIPYNEVTKELVQKHKKINKGLRASTFVDNITRTLWYDIAFAYEPYFSKKHRLIIDPPEVFEASDPPEMFGN